VARLSYRDSLLLVSVLLYLLQELVLVDGRFLRGAVDGCHGHGAVLLSHHKTFDGLFLVKLFSSLAGRSRWTRLIRKSFLIRRARFQVNVSFDHWLRGETPGIATA